MTFSLSAVFLSTELHSFLQTLLDLLQRADDYIRDKVDLTFFTQTLPQLVENVYSSAQIPRKRRSSSETGRAIKPFCTILVQPVRAQERIYSALQNVISFRIFIYHSPYCYSSNQQIILKEQVGQPALFQQVGPLVDDWESYLTGIAEDLDQHKELKNSQELSQEQQLFTPVNLSNFLSFKVFTCDNTTSSLIIIINED